MVIDDKFYVGGARDRQIIRMVRGIRRFHRVKYVPGVFVITLPLFGDGILEIYELNELRQKIYNFAAFFICSAIGRGLSGLSGAGRSS